MRPRVCLVAACWATPLNPSARRLCGRSPTHKTNKTKKIANLFVKPNEQRASLLGLCRGEKRCLEKEHFCEAKMFDTPQQCKCKPSTESSLLVMSRCSLAWSLLRAWVTQAMPLGSILQVLSKLSPCKVSKTFASRKFFRLNNASANRVQNQVYLLCRGAALHGVYSEPE